MERPISICIAARNEEATIRIAVESALDQAEVGPLEVLVCANGCTDRTESIVRELAAARPEVRLFSLARGGKPGAWNLLLGEAAFQHIVFADADVWIDRYATSALRRALETEPDLIAAAGTPWPVRLGCETASLRTGPYRIGGVNGRLYAVDRMRLLARMSQYGLTGMPVDLIGDDLWVSLIAGRRGWRRVPQAYVFFIPPKASELLRVARRNARARAQLRKLLPGLYRGYREPLSKRLSRNASNLWRTKGLPAKVKLIRRYIAAKLLIAAAWVMTSLEKRRGNELWEVAPSTKQPLPAERLTARYEAPVRLPQAEEPIA